MSFPSALRGYSDQEEGGLIGRDSRREVGPAACGGDPLLQGHGREAKQGTVGGRS